MTCLNFSLSCGRPGASWLALFLVCAGCALEDDSIARVGDRAITAQDVRAFIDRLPENAGAGKEQLRDHLQTIIDFELMLMEARSQGIDKSSAYLTRMDRIRKAKLVGEYERRFIDATLGPGEVEEYIERENLARAIKLADILVLNEDPLADIRNTTSLRWVMKNGVLYDADTLDSAWPVQRELPRMYWQTTDPVERR